MTGRGRGEQGDRGSEPLPLFCSRLPGILRLSWECGLSSPGLPRETTQALRPCPIPLCPPATPPLPPQLCFQAGCLSSDEEALPGCRQRVGPHRG